MKRKSRLLCFQRHLQAWQLKQVLNLITTRQDHTMDWSLLCLLCWSIFLIGSWHKCNCTWEAAFKPNPRKHFKQACGHCARMRGHILQFTAEWANWYSLDNNCDSRKSDNPYKHHNIWFYIIASFLCYCCLQLIVAACHSHQDYLKAVQLQADQLTLRVSSLFSFVYSVFFLCQKMAIKRKNSAACLLLVFK